MTNFEPSINERIWQVVAAVPPGRVATYGAIAHRAGLAGAARRVGAALRGLPQDTSIPWHRVINAQGKLSLPTGSGAYRTQRQRLEEEGVEFTLKGKVSLKKYGWE